ncbi:MAG: hypothetical protein HGB10_04125 [Coriobacteriia bacterium]|nr:hypothetical protein [Coriobacteriia bacterium]
MRRQPLEIQTLYAELLERLAAHEASRAIGHVPGSFVLKSVKGSEYYYFQHSEPGGTKSQTYVGRRDAALDAVAQSHADAHSALAPDVESIQRLCSLLRVGGAMVTDQGSARVLRALADAGVFRLGGVLVGTHAFVVLGNLLGVVWEGSSLRTQDVDVAADLSMSIVVPELTADAPGALESLEMGFLPVPALNRKAPSTSYKVRGQGLRVDFLAPAKREGQKPIVLPRLGASAQPLRFLDFVTENPVTAAVINGGGVSVNVPDPAHFALHKLIVANERPAAMHAKRDKDLWQASQLLEVLSEERPGDLRAACADVTRRGAGWVRRVSDGAKAVEKVAAGRGIAVLEMLRS